MSLCVQFHAVLSTNVVLEKSQPMRVSGILISLIFAIVSAGTARADAVLTFTPNTLQITPGGTVEFDGTLANTGTTAIYLNNDVFSFLSPDLTIDDSPFIFEGPSSLAAGDSFTGAFIDVTADAATLSGSYSGTYTIQGGADGDTFDDIATADFTLDAGSTSITPEPNPFLFLATGIMILAVAGLRRRSLAAR